MLDRNEGEGSGGTDLDAVGLATAQVARDGLSAERVDLRRSVGARVYARFTPYADRLVRNHCPCLLVPLSGFRRAYSLARRVDTPLTDHRDVNGHLTPRFD